MEAKLPSSPIQNFYPEFEGPAEFEPALEFFKKKYLARNKNKEKSVFTHATCMTDTGNINFVFNAVISIILENNLKDSGLA